MGVVEGRPEHLPAGQVLEGCRDPPGSAIAPVSKGTDAPKRGSVVRKARTRNTASTTSPRACLSGERREVGVVERALGHHAVDQQRHLLADLRDGQLRHGRVAAARLGEQPVGVVDGGFAALHGHVHGSALRDGGGARQTGDAAGRGEDQVDPEGKVGTVPASCATKPSGRGPARGGPCP